MANSLFETSYNPDVLTCLANLSNDEVFTPPNVVNDMLDMLPQELFSDPAVKFLDPVCKSGVFLREIAKRLIKGLEDKFPDLQERLDHIYHEQLYGIAITELTSLLSRRSVYCSKNPKGKYSVSHFDGIQGNVRFKNVEHSFENGRCVYCGASEKTFGRIARPEGLETHAYEFIHTVRPEEIWNMKFDVIIGNPPYQLSTGGGQAQATPLYNEFVEQAIKLNPRYLTMIIPARWYAGGFPAVKKLREDFVSSRKVSIIHDFPDASDCFPSVEIKGGVCYFLWDSAHCGPCTMVNHYHDGTISAATRELLEPHCDTIIRHNEAISILSKVRSLNEPTFNSIVGSLWPFTVKSSFDTLSETKVMDDDVFAFVMKKRGWIRRSEISKNEAILDQYKLFLPRSVGSADSKSDVLKPVFGDKNTACSGTYIICGPFENKSICDNVISYIGTRFFHYLLSLKKITQDTTQGCYELIPIQDFSKKWTDDALFEKYGLSEDEKSYIKAMVWPNKGE